jgi:hypothetical protein
LGSELELAYIKDIVNWVNKDGERLGKRIVKEHDQEWIDVRNRSLVELKKSLGVRD